MINDYVIVYQHFGFTTQLPPAPLHTYKKVQWGKYLLLVMKIFW